MACGIAAGGIAAGSIAAGGIGPQIVTYIGPQFSILSLSLPSHWLRSNVRASKTHGPHKHSMDASPKHPKTMKTSWLRMIPEPKRPKPKYEAAGPENKAAVPN